jgi:hypothetical protein
MGMATVRNVVSWSCMDRWELEGLTDGDAQAVGTDEVLTAVAAGELLAVAASSLGGGRVDSDLLVAIGSATLRSSEGNSGHGGDEERLEEGHFVDWG